MLPPRSLVPLLLAVCALISASLHAEDKADKPQPGKNDSAPASTFKAEARVNMKVAKAAVPTPEGAPIIGNLIVLTGTQNRPDNSTLKYQWKQIGGTDLKIQPKGLNEKRFGLRIRTPGKYKFQLTVTDGEETSEPAEVEVEVIESESK